MNIIRFNFKILFSLSIFVFSAFLLINNSMSEQQRFSGLIKEVSCQADKKRAGFYLAQIRLDNDARYHNKVELNCDSVAELKPGDWIEVESQGHIFIQIRHNGRDLFNKKLLALKISNTTGVFVWLWMLAGCDLVYRLYDAKKNKA